MRKFKTSTKNRTNYKYYDDDGHIVTTIKPGQDDVTTIHIDALHQNDDEQYDEGRRYEYGLNRFPEKMGKDGKPLPDDEQSHLADYDANPETQHIAGEDRREHEEKITVLKSAMKTLTQKENDIFWAYAVEGKSYTEIGRVFGCSRQAVTQRIETIRKKLLKFF